MIVNQDNLEKKFMKLAFNKASINVGSTNLNPSVGCIVVKNGAVISSGTTSIGGRPHAEFNALKKNLNFKGSTIYITLEPCVHYGKTNPCVNLIKEKKIKKVCYPLLDFDVRTRNKAKNFLNKNNIKVKIGILKNEALNFYKSYFLSKTINVLPYIDAKIAISKDFFSVNTKSKWITNEISRSKVHLMRSRYDCIVSTYKSINKDNSILDCRITGIENRSPSRVIIDKDLNLKRNLELYKSCKKIKTYVITGKSNKIKEKYLKSQNIKILKIKHKGKGQLSFRDIFLKLKKIGFTRILCEAGLQTINNLIQQKLIHNLYVFSSSQLLGKNGQNSYKKLLKQLKFKKKIKININLSQDQLYKFKIK